MAAPEGIVWGNRVGGDEVYGQIGIYKNVTSTATTTTVTVEIWIWTKYSCTDSNNTLYYDNRSASGSATTSVGTVSVKTTDNYGSAWSTDNQQKLKSYNYTYTRGTSAQTRYLYAKLSNIDRVGATMYASTTFTVPALDSYTVSYNANGGSDAPDSQKKWYGKALTLSSTKPTRTGYTFKGWATSASGSVVYAAGASYTANANVTLYAVWQVYTYSVKYNANGGSGAPASQTKTYGVTLKLSTTKPTRANYTFLGWAKSASATKADYAAGANYTANSAVTLYAVWKLAYIKPTISNLMVSRCDSEGNITDDGTCMKVYFDWKCTYTVSLIRISWGNSESDRWDDVDSVNNQLTSGRVNVLLNSGINLSPDQSYDITITVADSNDESTAVFPLSSAAFPIDILAEDKGVAFGKTAELEGVADFAFAIKPGGGFVNPIIPKGKDLNEITEPNTYIGLNVGSADPNYGNCPIGSGTFTLVVKSAGDNGQVWQRFTLCDKTIPATYERFYYGGAWGNWVRTSDFGGKLLWQGVYYMSASQTVTLAERVSAQKNGIVLVFSRYSSGAAQNYHFNHAFVHKAFVKLHPGVGNTFLMTTDGSFSVMATKYIYIHDDHIDGNAINEATGTGTSGVKYENNGFVLRYVIGV